MGRTESGRIHPLLLAVLGVAVVVGAVVMFSAGDGDAAEADAAAAEAAEAARLEVQPLVPQGKIVESSWRDAPSRLVREDDPEASSGEDPLGGIDWSDFGDDAEQKKRAEASLRETIKDVEGLGIYVAPPSKGGDDEDEDAER